MPVTLDCNFIDMPASLTEPLLPRGKGFCLIFDVYSLYFHWLKYNKNARGVWSTGESNLDISGSQLNIWLEGKKARQSSGPCESKSVFSGEEAEAHLGSEICTGSRGARGRTGPGPQVLRFLCAFLSLIVRKPTDHVLVTKPRHLSQ